MDSKKKFLYVQLDSNDTSTHSDELLFPEHGEKKSSSRPWSILMTFLVIQVFNLLLFSSGYAIWRFAPRNQHHMDPYLELARYNATKYFTGNASLTPHSAFSDDFWTRAQGGGGVVTVDTQWALQHFAPSRETPDIPGQSVYEVDVFHSIHCLYRIRNRLISLHPTTVTDPHTLHCVDYLREQLMCHGDIVLQATDDFLDFGDPRQGHICRDHDALAEWVSRNQWKGHHKFLKKVNGIKFPEGHNHDHML